MVSSQGLSTPLQMGKLKRRRVRLAQVPALREWESLGWNPHRPDSNVSVLSQQHTVARVCSKLLDEDIGPGRAEKMHRHGGIHFSVSNLGKM